MEAAVEVVGVEATVNVVGAAVEVVEVEVAAV